MISVVIPIKNEAANLPRCLASVAWANELFVVDSHSTDASVAVAERCSARVVQFDFNGTWPKKKNWALENLPFRNEWILLLDADEVMSPGAEAEISEIVRYGPADVMAYWINRRFWFMGKWLRHAYYPNWNLRLLRRGSGRFEQLTEGDTASGDNEVHEHLIVEGKTGRLQSEMDHYAFPSIDSFIEKHNRYSNWEARVACEPKLSGSHTRLQKKEVSWRRRLKEISHHLPFRPVLRFLYVYVWQRGFLDGLEGYYFARLHAVYELLCVVKARELRQQLASRNREAGN